MKEYFHKFAKRVSIATGSPLVFTISVILIVVWLFLGPAYGFSTDWQLWVNTATTIITFLMVFLIQNTQNRDALAIHLKLDELLRAVDEARNSLVDLEDLSDEELNQLQDEFHRLHEKYAALVADDMGSVQRALNARKNKDGQA